MKKILLFFCLVTAVLSSCTKNSVEQELERRVRNMGGASAQLGTVEYTISKIIKVDHDVFYKIGERKILFSSLSTMKAGVDLSKFCADSVVIDKKKNEITINLPHPQILSFNMPAENIKMEYSKTSALRSEFSVAERNEVLTQGEKAIVNAAEELGIFKDAEENVRTLFEAMLSSANYEKININFN